jgi:hypothetical protein
MSLAIGCPPNPAYLASTPRVDPVGLARKRRESLDLRATSTSQPQRSSVSWTNRAPFIDSIAARTGARMPALHTACESRQPIAVRRRCADLDALAALIQQQ